MKYFKILAIITILLFIYQIPIEAAGVYKWANAGKMRARVFDNGHQSETESGTQVATYYFDGHQNTGRSFTHYGFRNNGLRIGVKDWKDQNGTLYPVRLSGAPYGTSDASRIMFVIPDANQITIHKYMRYPPPSIVVDGMVLNDPFPFDEGDHVAPEKIPGTADMMIESHIRTWIGLDVHQRVFAWGQKNHDDYVLYELTFKNTGNVDYDDEIELPGQVLDSLYIMRSIGCHLPPAVIKSGVAGMVVGRGIRYELCTTIPVERIMRPWTISVHPIIMKINYASAVRVLVARRCYSSVQHQMI